MELFSTERDLFINSILDHVYELVHHPSTKSIKNIFDKLISMRRKEANIYSNTSENVEEERNLKVLLDALILKNEYFEVTKREKIEGNIWRWINEASSWEN